MAIEKERRCGFRKVGGLYLVSDGLTEPCHRLPFALTVCPACGAGVKQARSWTWVDGFTLLSPGCAYTGQNVVAYVDYAGHCISCPICSPALLGPRCGLLWVGEKFYPTPLDFVSESLSMGLSKRLSHVPKGLERGKTWVLLAHPKAISRVRDGYFPDPLSGDHIPGIFRAFIPSRLELLIWKSEATPGKLAELEKRGISPVIVPDWDPDHDPKGYKPDEDNGALPLGDP